MGSVVSCMDIVNVKELYMMELTNHLWAQLHANLLQNNHSGIDLYQAKYSYAFDYDSQSIIKNHESMLKSWLRGMSFQVYKPSHIIWFIVIKWEWKPDYIIPSSLMKKEFVCIVKNMVESCEAQHAINSVTMMTDPSPNEEETKELVEVEH